MKNFIIRQCRMRDIFGDYKSHCIQSDFFIAILSGTVFVIISLLLNHFADNYVNSRAGTYVTDILLDNIPVINVNVIVNEGVWLFTGIIFFFSFVNPKKIPFILKSISLFILVRSMFIILTHLGPMPQHSFLSPTDYLSGMAEGNDMFFSGHTGMPYLIALVFWKDGLVRNIALAASVIFGSSMIIGHLHYSIDVFSAFFITYGIFKISQRFFAKDYRASDY